MRVIRAARVQRVRDTTAAECPVVADDDAAREREGRTLRGERTEAWSAGAPWAGNVADRSPQQLLRVDAVARVVRERHLPRCHVVTLEADLDLWVPVQGTISFVVTPHYPRQARTVALSSAGERRLLATSESASA